MTTERFVVDNRDRPSEGGREGWRWAPPAFVALVLIGFGAVFVYAYLNARGDEAGEDTVAPLIRADRLPVKSRPDQPGGMAVPDQDKEIFRGIAGQPPAAAGTQRVERLLPPPEALLPKPAPEPPTMSALAPPPGAVPVVPPPAPQAQAAPIATPSQATAPAQAAPAQTVQQQPAQRQAEPPRVAPPLRTADNVAAVSPAAGGGPRIQLGALRDEDAAPKEWRRLQRAHGDLLGQLTLTVVRADLGDKGIYYRLQAGPMTSLDAAQDLCAQLRARKVGCLVAR